jgi:glycosyltransferase involved in cell wall biosynthesis
VEALACGAPVVAYNIPGVVDIIDNGKNGILVPERDVKAHALACRQLLESDKLRCEMGTIGRDFVRNTLTIEKMTDAILALYSKKPS